MSQWTKEKLEQMIADAAEESLTLEYKSALALAKTDSDKAEITKDVSAFANSSGGVLIYGIAEPADRAKRHFPERLDPIIRSVFSKESLEQIIQTIQPRIEGVVIHPVTIDEQANSVCYVVEVPQSHTAHQARDHVYYKRHNFNVLAMEDYEVRDVMNRKTHPKLRASIFINRNAKPLDAEGLILVRLENVGRVLAKYVMVELTVPPDVRGLISVDGPAIMTEEQGYDWFLFRLTPGQGEAPIFPGSDVTLRRKFKTNVRKWERKDGRTIKSDTALNISVFADEMPPVHAKMGIEPVLRGWTVVPN
ncbi:MAG: ATP-binding protein [Verrucomicrobiia bacterium]